jgi:hypothetical protein
MDCHKNTSFTIRGSRLLPCRENHFNFHLGRINFQIIKGIVYCLNQTPSAGAVVLITQVDMVNHTSTVLGYSITDEAGRYVFSLEAQPDMKYEISVFAPLVTFKKGDI